MHPLHRETHLIERIGWLRAAVLGANDGAQTGGAGILRPMMRVTFWGAIAMGTTAVIGRLVGHAL
jgi:vacuolar iron transporter family protein